MNIIENATRAIKVIHDNGEEYEAKIVGLDKNRPCSDKDK